MSLQHTYGANGAATLFPFSFAVGAASDVEVLIDAIEQTSGFVVRGAGGNDGGSVLFDAAPALGAMVTLRHRGRVSVSALDTASGHLADKLVAGTGVSLSVAADADGRQRLVVAAVEQTSDLYLKKDATPEEIAAFLVEYGVATNTLDNVAPEIGRTRLEVLSEQDSDDRYVKKSPVGTEAEEFRAAYEMAKTDLSNVDPQTALDRIGAQAHDADLDWLSTNITPAGKALLDDADAAAQRTTLGVYSTGEVFTKVEANQLFAIATPEAETTVALDDLVRLFDASTGIERRMRVDDLLKAVNLLDVDATPDLNADYLLTWDASAGSVKKAPIAECGGSGTWELFTLLDLGNDWEGSFQTSIELTGFDTSLYEYKVYFEHLAHSKTYPNTDTIHLQIGTGAIPSYITTGYRIHAVKTSPTYATQTLIGGHNQSHITIDAGSDCAYRSIQYGCLHLKHSIEVNDGNWFPGYVEYKGAYHTYPEGFPNWLDVNACWNTSAPVSAIKLFTGSGIGFRKWGRIRVLRHRMA